MNSNCKTPEMCLPPLDCTPCGICPNRSLLANKKAINSAIHAIEAGLEYARQCLAEHDLSLGRTTHKNRNRAETIEGDIEQMERALNLYL